MAANPFKVHLKSQARYDACRLAVMPPLLGHNWAKPTPRHGMTRLRARWCKQLRVWQPAQKLFLPGTCTQTENMLYCPDFGVYHDRQSRPCDRALVCPYCSARRYVLDPFVGLETILYGDLAPRAPLRVPKDTVLYRFSMRRRIVVPDEFPWSPENQAQLYQIARDVIQERKWRQRNWIDVTI